MTAQHHAQDVMRAIETDRWLVRAANTGLSGVIDPHGNTRWLSGINVYQLHADIIYRRQTQTLYVRWGNWLLPLLVITSAIAIAAQNSDRLPISSKSA
jgi:apolipoprotein N-acyltransferase